MSKISCCILNTAKLNHKSIFRSYSHFGWDFFNICPQIMSLKNVSRYKCKLLLLIDISETSFGIFLVRIILSLIWKAKLTHIFLESGRDQDINICRRPIKLLCMRGFFIALFCLNWTLLMWQVLTYDKLPILYGLPSFFFLPFF